MEELRPFGGTSEQGVWGFWTGMHMLGVVERGGNCLLIDSGLGDAPARRCLEALRARGWSAVALVHTHAHADHSGGSAWLRKNAGLRVWATPEQAGRLAVPEGLVMQLYGALPPRALRLRFLEAAPCAADALFSLPLGANLGTEDGDNGGPGDGIWARCVLDGFTLECRRLPGHTPDSIAIRPEGGPVFLGDAVFPEATDAKWKLSYYEDVAAYRRGLDAIEGWRIPCVVAHEGIIADIGPLVAHNRKVLDAVDALLLRLLEEGEKTLETLTLEAARALEAPMPLSSFYLMRATLAAHMTELAAHKEAVWEMGEEGPVWRHG